MTRKVTANVYMTLDGRGVFPTYPGSDAHTGPPGEADEFFRTMWADRYKDVTTVVMGRRSFTGHQRVHSTKGRKPTDPKFLFDYSRFLDQVDKVCLSRRLKKTDWENSRILKGDLARIVAKLRREKGGNIILEGGPRLISEVIRLNLADDYRIFVMPVVYGRGPRYWNPMTTQTNLKFLSVSHMPYGELLLHYGAVRKGGATPSA